MSKNTGHDQPAKIGDLSFLIGEWRGKGEMPSQEGKMEYQIHMVCLKAPGGDGIQIVQFDDDKEKESMFYAEHIQVFPDKTTGHLRAKREGFAFSDMGDTLFVMNENVTKTAKGIRFKSDPASKNALQNDVVFSRVGENGLRLEGTTKAGDSSWSTEFNYVRRVPGKRQ
ncbi:MAG: hypothetical protein M1422_04045 [Candidatus Thermoplasmatota archaeon]|nr:hypothetical protein [Candidatus Thermoplasmatota archaeon]